MGGSSSKSSYYSNPRLRGLNLKDLNDPDLRPDTVQSGVGASPAVGSTFIDPASKFALPSVNPIALVPNIVRFGMYQMVVHNQSKDPRGDIDYLIPARMPTQQAEGINIGALLDRRHIPFITKQTPPINETTTSVTGPIAPDKYLTTRFSDNNEYDDVDREQSDIALRGTPVRVSEPWLPQAQSDEPGYVSDDPSDYTI